ncbi:MAG: hypothetical protein WA081_20005 [Desulfosalsimonadaceae bacterium]
MDASIHILHLEDDPADAELVQVKLEEAGIACRITHVQTRDEFDEALRRERYDTILADYRLPMYDGYAWAMQDALMVGYVTGHYLFEMLASVLDDKKSASLKTNSHEVDEYSIYHSDHTREFEWLENRGQACRISIAHLWLSVDGSTQANHSK